MKKLNRYMCLLVLVSLVSGRVSFAQEFDKGAFEAELRQKLMAEFKVKEEMMVKSQQEMMAKFEQEMKELMAELKTETKAEVQEATVGLKDVLMSDFTSEIRAQIMEETRDDITSQIDEALEGSALMSGMFKGVNVSGFLDINYIYNLRNHGEGVKENNGPIANFLGADEDDSFTFDSFAMFFDKETTDDDPIGWQMHTYWGEMAKTLTWAGDSTAADTGRGDIFTVATANITWDAPVFGKKLPITFGKMYSWLGYELVENIANPNYQRSTTNNQYMSYTNLGFKVELTDFIPSDKWQLSLHYVNGWDSFIDTNSSKTYGFYTSYAPNDEWFFSVGAMSGAEGWGVRTGDSTSTFNFQRNVQDNGNKTSTYNVIATYSLPQVERLSLGVEWMQGFLERGDPHDGLNSALTTAGDGIVDSATDITWWGLTGYAQYDYTDSMQGALRYEYVDDAGMFVDFSMWSVTYTHNITVANNLMLRPEIRYFKYNTPSSEDPIAVGDKGNTADSETTLGFAAEYVF